MNLDDFKNQQNDPDLIPGIYNYCDRWCERCRLSSRCLLFKMENRNLEKDTDEDLSTEENFWKELQSTFELTSELLQDLAEKLDLDPEELQIEDEDTKVPGDDEIEQHPIVDIADQYYHTAKVWLRRHKNIVREKERLIHYITGERREDVSDVDTYLILNDLYVMINWYHSMIRVKAKRAVMGVWEEEGENEIQNDMNGTAKVLGICVKRSAFAWNKIAKYMGDGQKLAMQNLSLLHQLKEYLDEYFPNAEKFVRPGFDEDIQDR